MILKMDAALDKKLSAKLEKYDKVCRSFSKFMHEDELKYVLNSKADTKKVDSLLASKASLQELGVCC